MIKRIFPNNLTRLFLFVYLITILWWLLIFLGGKKEEITNYSFSLFYTLIPLLGFIFGIKNAKRWGGLKSEVGSAIVLLSIGQLAWATGNIIFAFYNLFLHVPVP